MDYRDYLRVGGNIWVTGSVGNPEGVYGRVAGCGCFLAVPDRAGYMYVVLNAPVSAATAPEEILTEISKGSFDIPLLRSFGGVDLVQGLKERCEGRVKQKEEEKALVAKRAALDEAYPQIPEELKRMVRNHDYYYSYSDDNRVWRAGKASEEKLISELTKLGCSEYLGKYHTLK